MSGLKEQLKRLDFSLNSGLIDLDQYKTRKTAIEQAVKYLNLNI